MQLKSNNRSCKSWVEVSKKALVHNFRTFRKIAGPRTKILSVVKANAYGHGLKEVVPIFDKVETDWFGVDNLAEALEIRNLRVGKPILIMGYVPASCLKEAIENDISLTVYSKEILLKILSLNLKKKARIHLKIETGLNRQGLKASEVLKLARLIKVNKNHLILEGLSTHFANIEDTLDSSFAFQQFESFKRGIRLLRRNGFNPPIKHCAASAAAFLHPQTHFNLIRVGIGLYGLWPSKETRIALSLKKERESISLKPVLTWKSIIAQVKTLRTGESVGYGRTWYASRKSKTAVIPVGYWDGYDRGFSNNSRVLIGGKYVPVVGRVAMNMVMVDVSVLEKVKAGDEVVLLGSDRGKKVTADELAARLGTINYEIVSRINSFLPRIVV